MKNMLKDLIRVSLTIAAILILATLFENFIVPIVDRPKCIKGNAPIMRDIELSIKNFKEDIGFYPYFQEDTDEIGNSKTNSIVVGPSSQTNVLINPNVFTPEIFKFQLTKSEFQRKWRGPYFDASPMDFQEDQWKHRILFERHLEKYYLHSCGPDGFFDSLYTAISTEYNGDDIVHAIK